MSDDVAWRMVEDAITGILTTLRADGRPVALPVWSVVIDRRIYVRTRGRKVDRVRRDGRCSFLVESGERWVDLRAVHLDCVGTVIEPAPALDARLDEAFDRKYAPYRARGTALPDEARATYAAAARSTIELVPQGRLLTWDNRRLG